MTANGNRSTSRRPPWRLKLPLEIFDGRVVVTSSRSVEETARLILSVEPGERSRLPEFGWLAHRLPHLDTSAQRAIAAVQAENALSRWAPDLAVERVDVEQVERGSVRLILHRGGQRHVLSIPYRRGQPQGAKR